MRSRLCVLLFVAWANALPMIPLGHTVTPKIPIVTNVPVIANVPIAVPNCGCGFEVATVVPSCGCVDKIVPQCGCGCDTLLLDSPILTSCGCLETSPSCGCVERALVNPCGCGLPVATCGCNGCGTCGYGTCGCGTCGYGTCGCGTCGYNPCSCAQSACLTVDPVTTCGCTVPALQVVEVPTCATPCIVSTCGCPTLPPFPPVVGCCGKYLRKICVQPPFL